MPVWKNIIKRELYLIGLIIFTLVSSSNSSISLAYPTEESSLTNQKKHYCEVMNTTFILAVEDRKLLKGFLGPWCSGCHYYTISLNKAWTKVLHRLESCLRLVHLFRHCFFWAFYTEVYRKPLQGVLLNILTKLTTFKQNSRKIPVWELIFSKVGVFKPAILIKMILEIIKGNFLPSYKILGTNVFTRTPTNISLSINRCYCWISVLDQN